MLLPYTFLFITFFSYATVSINNTSPGQPYTAQQHYADIKDALESMKFKNLYFFQIQYKNHNTIVDSIIVDLDQMMQKKSSTEFFIQAIPFVLEKFFLYGYWMTPYNTKRENFIEKLKLPKEKRDLALAKWLNFNDEKMDRLEPHNNKRTLI